MRRTFLASAAVCLLLTGCATKHMTVHQPASVTAPPAAPHDLRSKVERTVTREVNVRIVAAHSDGSVFYDHAIHNLRTTGGGDWQPSAMSNTAAQPAAMNWIALSNDAAAPAVGDCAAGSVTCTLASEITLNGLGRAQATYAHSNGTSTYTLTKTFTATGTQAAQKAAIFNASSSGTMGFEAAFTQVSLGNGDTVTVTWTITI